MMRFMAFFEFPLVFCATVTLWRSTGDLTHHDMYRIVLFVIPFDVSDSRWQTFLPSFLAIGFCFLYADLHTTEHRPIESHRCATRGLGLENPSVCTADNPMVQTQLHSVYRRLRPLSMCYKGESSASRSLDTRHYELCR
ncbi:hypothetical protein FB446DRAFT_758756 [Lentinula raphanica]|nr:hypothetical protein FB446DRAFT_758756 [Lentinula raphanica]